jgi:hypothetical protein
MILLRVLAPGDVSQRPLQNLLRHSQSLNAPTVSRKPSFLIHLASTAKVSDF